MVKQTEMMSMADLVGLYNRMSPEKPVKRFSSLAEARKRVDAMTKLLDKSVKSVVEEKKAKAGSSFTHVRALPNGRTTLQKNSIRRKVFEAIAAALHDKKEDGKISITALNLAMDCNARPHCMKLKEGGHIETFKQ